MTQVKALSYIPCLAFSVPVALLCQWRQGCWPCMV